ncbi:MAG: DUF222 domain-containing protein [Mycobacteriales bacterium]
MLGSAASPVVPSADRDPERDDAVDAAGLVAAEARAARRVELSLASDGDGGSWLRGRLDAEGTAVLRAALDPLSGPRPSTVDGPDLRPAGRRRGEALVEVCRRVLAGGSCPRAHHRLVEHGDWQVRLAADGRPEFHPPRWIDPERRPRRNHLHDRPD